MKIAFKKAKYRVQVKKANKGIMILKYYMKDLAFNIRKKILQQKATAIQHVIKQYLWFIRLERIK